MKFEVSTLPAVVVLLLIEAGGLQAQGTFQNLGFESAQIAPGTTPGPVPVETNFPAGLTNGLATAAGTAHSLVLKGDGRVIAWGRNDNRSVQGSDLNGA